MLSFLRRASKSSIGTVVMIAVLLAILAGFAIADINSVKQGIVGQSSDELVTVGHETLTDRAVSDAAKLELDQMRKQNPDATYAALAPEFDALIDRLTVDTTLKAFATDHGFVLSKRLVDAEIAKIPAAKGLDGKFSEASYAAFLQQQRMTDAQLRGLISSAMLQRFMLAPAAVEYRVPLGVARPYGSLQLEEREGQFTLIPVDLFRAGLDPSEGDLQSFYGQNRQRYMVPEQRVLKFAMISPDSVEVPAPTEKEIEDYYKANQASYAGSEQRVISQAVVQDKAVADRIAAKARDGEPFATAASEAGYSAADVSVGPQTKAEFTSLAGAAVTDATFAAADGAVVGPVRSDLGWHVIKIDGIRGAAGKSLEQARAEIVKKLTDDKRQNVLADSLNKLQDAIDDGSNFGEAAAAAKLKVVTTPPIVSTGLARGDANYTLPADFKPGLSVGFDLESGDEPEIVTLPDNKGYLLVGLDSIIASAPAPLAEIRNRVRADWIDRKASDRARAVADDIAKKVAAGTPMDKAAAEAGVKLPPVQPMKVRRFQLAQVNPDAATPLQMLFSLKAGKSRLAADPKGRGFFVVKTDKITAGDASSHPEILPQVTAELQQMSNNELATEFVNAMKVDQGIKRNEPAIAAAKDRITGSDN